MRKFSAYLSVILGFLISGNVLCQVGPPSLRCASVNATGDITITWVIPPDPSGLFTSYKIFSSQVPTGPYTSTLVNTYTQNTFTEVGAGGNIQFKYYYIQTISSGGSSVSLPSDTLQSIFLNRGSSTALVAFTWNKTHTPLLPSASTSFTLTRENPTTVWTQIYAGPNLRFTDTISLCNVYYNYKVLTDDGAGCTSQSNIDGAVFHDQWPARAPLLDSVSVNANGSATLGWEPSTSPDATRYVIYKVILGVNSAIDTVNGRFTTTYTDVNPLLPDTGPQTYLIAVLDSCKNISIISPKPQTTIYLSLGYDFCARTSKLSWTRYVNLLNGELKYNIYCSVNGGAPAFLGSTPATTFSHPGLNPGDTYCYFVKVVNTGETITANSNVKCLIATAPQGPAYVYIRSVSVTPDKAINVTYAIDNSRAYKGAAIFKSKDGITFNQISYQPAAGSSTLQTYVDKEVSVTEKNYYYKIQIYDSCGNPGKFSNISKTVLLHVSNDTENIFYNTLTWDDYSSWSGNVASYNIYRAVNGIFDTSPVTNVPYGTRLYVDDVEEFVSDRGKFSYYVEAVEGGGNIYGFQDVAQSNPADAYVEVSVFVPNSFCPNGLNKIWLPVAQYVEKTDYKVTVFDRWGSKVFQTSSDTEGWDGKGGKDDVYVYLIEYKNARGEFIQLKGYLTLIK